MKYLIFLVKLQPWSDMNCRGAHSNIPLRNIAISLKEHLILNQHVDFILKCMALDPPKTAKQRKVNITHSLILAALLLWIQSYLPEKRHLSINLHFFFSRYLNKGRCAKMNLHFYLFQKAKHLKRRFERIFQQM